MVTLYVPGVVALVDDRVRVEAPDVAIDAGENAAFTPEGIPAAVIATVPVNPFRAETVVVKFTDFPGVTVCNPGLAERLKSG